MSDIWKVIAKIGVELHPDRIDAIALSISNLNSQEGFEKVRASFGAGTDRSLVDQLKNAWRATPILTPLELAAALKGASVTTDLLEKREMVEMVWTGPFTGLVASRHTEQVLMEVINSAKDRLFIVSFVAYNIETVMEALQKAIDRNVRVDILLESSKFYGGKVDIDSIDAFRKGIPAANIYAWSTESKTSGEWNGAVHAKCAVADGSLAFITSANITRAAMENNMELGVLVRGGNLPEKLERHLEALVTTGVINNI